MKIYKRQIVLICMSIAVIGAVLFFGKSNAMMGEARNADQATFEFTTETDIVSPIITKILLLDGDNDGDNDTIDLQDGYYAGQTVKLVAAADIDTNDIVTVSMSDTICTNCSVIIFDEVGENTDLIWTGTTWITGSSITAIGDYLLLE